MNARRLLPYLVVAALPFVTGCRGKLLATGRLTAPGTVDVHFRATKPVALWSDYDGTWSGSRNSKLPLHYDIEVHQNGKSLGRIGCDTDHGGGTSVCGTSSNINGTHTANCEVDLPCQLPHLAPGDVLLRVTGKIADPSRVTRVNLMSLNVRER